jgi:hypothetical protein
MAIVLAERGWWIDKGNRLSYKILVRVFFADMTLYNFGNDSSGANREIFLCENWHDSALEFL